MGQLIPLTLQPSTSGVESLMKPSPPPNRPLPEIPVRSSRRPAPEMLNLQVPRTQKDWHKVLDEVRSLYLKKQYKQCSARCVRLLEEVKDMEFPLYRIYVSFYAATCLELTGRHMPMSSSKKLQLYELARLHYQNAQHYMWQACKERSPLIVRLQTEPGDSHESSAFTSLDQSTTPSRSSTCSTTDSAVSLSFTTPVHSPASSISSFSSTDGSTETTIPQHRRHRKKVTFQPNVENYKFSANDNIPDIPALPKISPTQTADMSSMAATEESPIPSNDIPTTSDTFSHFLFSRSLIHYQAHLASLGVRLTHHMSILDALISEIQAQKEKPCYMRASPQGRSCDLKSSSKRAVKYDTFCYIYAQDYTLFGSEEQQKERENKMRARADRTQELKRRGEEWKNGKGRFDGTRYELLCEEVMRELDI